MTKVSSARNNESYLVFRYDDFHSYSRIEPEDAILRIFSKNRVKCVFGVIPFVCKSNWRSSEFQNVWPLTREKITFLKDASLNHSFEIALHGFSHQNMYKKRLCDRFQFARRVDIEFSEFYGQSYRVQLEKLMLGKEYLESLLNNHVTTFIPPWDTYDANTAKALEQLGFRVLSAGQKPEISVASSVKLFHTNCTLRDLRSVLQIGAETFFKNRRFTIIESHAFDFKEIGDKRAVSDYEELDKIITHIKQESNVKISDFRAVTAAV